MKTKKKIIFFIMSLSVLFGYITGNENVFAKENENKKICGSLQPEHIYVDDSKFSDNMFFQEENPRFSSKKAITSYNWGKFTSKYYYNMLNDEEKALWDKMDKQCIKYLTGTASLKVKGIRCEMPFIKNNLTMENMEKVWILFVISNPQYYFVNYGATYGKNSMALTMITKYADGTKRAKVTEEMRVKVEQWLDDIEENSESGFDRIRTAAHLVCEKLTYDYDALGNDSKLMDEQSVITAIKDQLTVCAGYQKAFSMLGCALGYEVIGGISDNHGWNYVKIDGKWYLVDTTWADQGIIVDGNTLFVSSKNQAVNNVEHKPVKIFKNLIPTCKKDYATDHGATVSEIVVEVGKNNVKINNTYDMAPPYTSNGFYTLDGSLPNSDSLQYDLESGISTKDLKPGTTIKIVYQLYGVNSRVWSYTYKGLKKPVITDIDNTEQGIKIKWTCKAKAAGYKIYRKTEKKDYELIVDVKAADAISYSYKDKKAEEGVLYKYAIVAYNAKGTESERSHAESMCWMTCNIGKVKKNTSTSMRVDWDKNEKAKGYQISYSVSSTFTSAKNTTVTGMTSTTIEKLEKGKEYFVRIRSYKIRNGVKYYSAWSNTKSCKL